MMSAGAAAAELDRSVTNDPVRRSELDGARSIPVCDFFSATGVWTVAWLASACLAVSEAVTSGGGPAWLGAGVSLLMASAYVWTITRLLRSGVAFRCAAPAARSDQRRFREPWTRRFLGYFAVILFVGVGVAWNIGFMGRLLEAADEGEGWWVLVSIPWCLIGWLLLGMLFAASGVLFRSLLTVLRRIAS
jgi:hypothetical protein